MSLLFVLVETVQFGLDPEGPAEQQRDTVENELSSLFLMILSILCVARWLLACARGNPVQLQSKQFSQVMPMRANTYLKRGQRPFLPSQHTCKVLIF